MTVKGRAPEIKVYILEKDTDLLEFKKYILEINTDLLEHKN